MRRSCVRDNSSTPYLNGASPPLSETDAAMNPASHGLVVAWYGPAASRPERIPAMPNPLLAPLMRWFGRLSYPKLFLLTAVLFVGDVLVPDMIPFVDELLLGLGTLLLANWKRVRPGRGRTIEDEPRRGD